MAGAVVGYGVGVFFQELLAPLNYGPGFKKYLDTAIAGGSNAFFTRLAKEVYDWTTGKPITVKDAFHRSALAGFAGFITGGVLVSVIPESPVPNAFDIVPGYAGPTLLPIGYSSILSVGNITTATTSLLADWITGEIQDKYAEYFYPVH